MKSLILSLIIIIISFTSSANTGSLYCSNLVQAICSDVKQPLFHNRILKIIRGQHLHTLTASSTLSEKRLSGTSAAQYAESMAYAEGQLARSDVQQLFLELRSKLIGLVSNHAHLSPATKAAMIARLQQTTFAHHFDDFFKGSSTLLSNAFPAKPRSEAEDVVFTMYANACDLSGMNRNAINFSFGAQGFVYICPGYLIYLSDRGMNRQQSMNALALMIGHELGHSIDSRFFPEVYEKMGECYNKITGNQSYWKGVDEAHSKSSETVSDYWGTELFSSRILEQNIGGQDLVSLLGHGAQAFCDSNFSSHHPVGFERIEYTISRALKLYGALGCPRNPETTPVCGFSGLEK